MWYPQGSILGPLLSFIYTNDLSFVSQERFTVTFADDTSLFMKGSNICEMENIMNMELMKVTEWLKVNKVSLNVGKTHSMLFSNHKDMLSHKN